MFVSGCLRAVGLLLVGVSVLAALPPAAGQQERYRERQVLDPESDEWIAQPPQEQAVPAGPLDEARRLLAEGRPRRAYKLLKRWVKDNPDDERYFEGVYLLGEAEFARGRYYQAYENYEQVVESASGELFDKALRREMDVARAFLAGQKRIVWGFLRLPAYDDGIEILDRIWERVPGTALGEEALKLKADHFFAVGDVDLAQDEYVNLVREYPGGRYLQLAMLRAAEAAEAAFPGIHFDDRALLDAAERYSRVLQMFPGLAEREQVADRIDGIRQLRAEKDLSIARWYQRTGHPEAAEFYYRLVLRDWPQTLAAAEARQGLIALGVELPAEEQQP